MAAIDIFGLCRMQVFADLIHDQLGVEVRMRGNKICADLNADPPIIYLPNLEYAEEEDVSVLRGFALHEAGHVAHTDPKALAGIEDYLTFHSCNAFEDQRIEVKLRRDFPGGKEMLQESQNAGYKVHLKGDPTEILFGTLDKESYLDPKRLRKHVIRIGKDMVANKLRLTCEEYKKWVYEDPEITAFMDKNGLDDEELYALGLRLLKGNAKRIGLADDEKTVLAATATRMEAIRFLHVWLYVWRGGEDRDIHRQYKDHPYKPFHDEIMSVPSRFTRDSLEKAQEYLRRLDVQPILPCDYRPCKEAQEAIDEAEQERHTANNAHSARRRVEKERDRKAQEMIEQSLERRELGDAKTEVAEKEQESRENRKDVQEGEDKEKKAESNLRRVRDRLARERRRSRELEREAEEAEEQAKAEDAERAKQEKGEKGSDKRIIRQHHLGDMNPQPGDGEKPEGDGQPVPQPGQGEGDPQDGEGQPGDAEGDAEGEEVGPARQKADDLAARAQRLRERIENDERLLDRREAELGMAQDDLGRSKSELEKSNARLGDAQKAAAAAQAKDDENSKQVKEKVGEDYKPMIDPLATEASAKEQEARASESKRDRILEVIHDLDRKNDEQIAEGVAQKMVDEAFEKARNRTLAEEMDVEILSDGMKRDDDMEGGKVTSAPVAAMSARKYVPFDRAYDKFDRVKDSPKAMTHYEECRREYAEVIAATTERLRKLWSPEKNRIKVNAETGRLDPRNAYKIGLLKKGANVDVTRVWKTITTKKDPRVAVSLLVDCSGSMGGQQINLAMKAACCLSEVMRALHIPHEIIGHTTSGGNAAKLDMDGVDADQFSRFCPFRGYIFKEFNENIPPTNVFSDFNMDCNLDGEAVMWALKRLERRKEKTKICVVMSDGMPHAPLSQIDELERHLFTVCKKAEALEKDGMYLYGLGIGEERVKEFYKYYSVLNQVGDLPVVTLQIVEHILAKMVGSL